MLESLPSRSVLAAIGSEFAKMIQAGVGDESVRDLGSSTGVPHMSANAMGNV